jgi:hypothetical protein
MKDGRDIYIVCFSICLVICILALLYQKSQIGKIKSSKPITPDLQTISWIKQSCTKKYNYNERRRDN